MASVKSIEKLLDRLGKPKLFFILPAFSGLLLGVGFIFPSLRPLVWIALLPLLFFLNSGKISLKESFFAGFITGFIFLGQVFLWIFEVTPNFTDMRSEALNFFLISLIWLTLSGFLALFTGLFSLIYQFLKRRSLWNILLIPSLWVIFDYLRVWAFGVFTGGSESLLGSHWTLGNLAYSLAQNQNLRLLAGVGGIYLVSFLIVLVGALLFYLFSNLISGKEKIKTWYLGGFLLILFLISASYFFAWPIGTTGEGEALKVAIVQTKIPSSFSPEKFAEEKSQVQRQLLEVIGRNPLKAEIIILPEGSNFLKKEGNEEYISGLFPEGNIWLIDSGKNKEKKFIGLLYNTKEGISAKYEKRLLVPYGDYLPYIFKFVSGFINQEWLEYIEGLKGTRRGDRLPLMTISKERKIGLFFCSEAVSPSIHRDSAERGGQVFLNAGSLAFSGGSKILDSQTLSMLQFRAAENGSYLVRATNYGSSYILDDTGEIVRNTNDLGNQVVLGKVQLVYKKTFYAEYGDWILGLAGFILLTFSLTCVILKKRKIET